MASISCYLTGDELIDLQARVLHLDDGTPFFYIETNGGARFTFGTQSLAGPESSIALARNFALTILTALANYDIHGQPLGATPDSVNATPPDSVNATAPDSVTSADDGIYF
jgi:hypothetical protein